jgi:hypothetical protein
VGSSARGAKPKLINSELIIDDRVSDKNINNKGTPLLQVGEPLE